jgi:cytoskeleton protein RodZ
MQTIGERLEEARKKKGISIREAAESTKIRGDYLQKFESNQFDIGLTEIYTRGFLRTYANFLKVPADRLLNDYSALGRGEAKPRQPSREVYGRMDITVASAGEASERATPPNEETNSPIDPNRSQPRYPRGGTSLPSGPDPAVIFKYAKWAGAAILALLLILIIKSFFGDEEKPRANSSGMVSAQPGAPTLKLVALGNLTVKVARVGEQMNDGEIIFEGALSRNETKVIPRPGELFITANPAENLTLEINGKRVNLPAIAVGNWRGKLPAP